MFNNKKTAQVEEYVSPSANVLDIIAEDIICGSRPTGEKISDAEDWDGEDNWN